MGYGRSRIISHIYNSLMMLIPAPVHIDTLNYRPRARYWWGTNNDSRALRIVLRALHTAAAGRYLPGAGKPVHVSCPVPKECRCKNEGTVCRYVDQYLMLRLACS